MGSSIWIVIPTYWGSLDSGIYDHPTPLDGESTLPGLLESLVNQNFQDSFHVLILVSTVTDELDPIATSRVEEISHRYDSQLNLVIANGATSSNLDKELRRCGFDLGMRDLRGYAAVRNLQLLFPALQGAETIIALDDDEIVAPNFLEKATEKIGGQIGGEKIVGLAGPYLDEAGSPYLMEPDKETNLLLDKSILMNNTMRKLCVDEPDLALSPIAFGGNMIFHRDLFSKVGFDPGITRGEDIDYLINARIAGFDFYFSPGVKIVHLPPRQYEAPLYAKLRQDVIRFEYERYKIDHFGINSESLMPYPGALLTEEFPSIALQALRLITSPELQSRYGSPQEIVAFSIDNAELKLQEYLDFQERWVGAMEIIKDDGISVNL